MLKGLQAVLKSLEKNNLYLAESAMVLVRLQTYELPYHKKHISKLKNVQLDVDKKITDLNKRSEESMARFANNCKKYGVIGDDLIKELTDLTTGLGDFLNGVATKCKDLEDAISLYDLYAGNHRGADEINDEDGLQLLKYVVLRGNTSVYQFENGCFKESWREHFCW